jgi:outer membrane protein assembly factor BamB
LVHAGAVHDSHGLLPGNSFVACRAYPSGEPLWVFTADVQATDLDTDGDHVYVTFSSGDLLVLRAADGAVRARHEVRLDGRRVIPLSLAVAGPGRVVIGTLDGRVLACSVDITPER